MEVEVEGVRATYESNGVDCRVEYIGKISPWVSSSRIPMIDVWSSQSMQFAETFPLDHGPGELGANAVSSPRIKSDQFLDWLGLRRGRGDCHRWWGGGR